MSLNFDAHYDKLTEKYIQDQDDASQLAEVLYNLSGLTIRDKRDSLGAAKLLNALGTDDYIEALRIMLHIIQELGAGE